MKGYLICGNSWCLSPKDIVRMPSWRKSRHAGKFGRVIKLHPMHGNSGMVTVQFAGEAKAVAVLPIDVVCCPLRSRLSQRKTGAKQ